MDVPGARSPQSRGRGRAGHGLGRRGVQLLGESVRGLRDAGVRSPGSGRSGKHKPCGAEGEIVSVTITLVTRAMLATRARPRPRGGAPWSTHHRTQGIAPWRRRGPPLVLRRPWRARGRVRNSPALQKPLRSPPHRGCGLRTARDDPRGQRPFGRKLHLIEAFEPKPGGHVLGSCHGGAYSLFSSASRCCSSLRLRIGGGVMT